MQDRTLMRLRNWIAESGVARGARLPPERELSGVLGVSRAELRKAFLLLETEGQVERHVGRGTFLSKAPRAARTTKGTDAAIADLSQTTGPVDAMAARLVLEPELARLAALNATPAQLRHMQNLSDAMRSANSWTVYEALDHDFHSAVAKAAGNAMLHALAEILNGVRQIVVWRRLAPSDRGPNQDYHSFDEHDAIIAALQNRDGSAASDAMAGHLKSTLHTMTMMKVK